MRNILIVAVLIVAVAASAQVTPPSGVSVFKWNGVDAPTGGGGEGSGGIDSTAGAFTLNNTVTVYGTGFGTRSGVPELWDYINGGISASWSGKGALRDTTGSRISDGTLAAYYDMAIRGDTQDMAAVYWAGGSSKKWFVEYWFKLDPGWDWGYTYGDWVDGGNLSNVKIIRFYNHSYTSNPINLSTATALPSPCLGSNVEHVTGEPNRYIWCTFQNDITLNTWHQLQFEFQCSSGVGVSDGQLRAWFDGRKVIDVSNYKQLQDIDSAQYPYNIGWYDSWDDALNTGTDIFWLDEMKAMGTFARVEVGDAGGYEQCTLRETQPIVSWSDTELSFTFKPGFFSSSDSLYVYVTDSNGNVRGPYATVMP